MSSSTLAGLWCVPSENTATHFPIPFSFIRYFLQPSIITTYIFKRVFKTFKEEVSVENSQPTRFSFYPGRLLTPPLKGRRDDRGGVALGRTRGAGEGGGALLPEREEGRESGWTKMPATSEARDGGSQGSPPRGLCSLEVQTRAGGGEQKWAE